MQQQGIQARGMLPVHTHVTPEQGGQINNDDLFQSCGFFGYRNGAQAIPTGVQTKVLWDRELFDIADDFDADGVDSDFLVRTTGYYEIATSIMFGALADASYGLVHVFLDAGSILLAQSQSGIAGADLCAHVAGKRYLNLGARLTVVVEHNHGGNRNICENINASFFCVFKVGE